MNKIKLIFFILAFSLFSCNKEISNCYDCQGGLIQDFTLNFDLPNVSFTKDLKNFHKESINLSYTSVNPTDFNKIVESLKTKQPLSNIYSLVLYVNINFDSTSKVQLENIIGFSSYETINDALFHKLYVKTANSFETEEKYSCYVKAVRANDNNKLAQLFLSSTKSVSWLMIYSEDVKPISINSSHQLSLITK